MEKPSLLPYTHRNTTGHGLVVFDGFCVLCSATVKFLLKIDKNKILKFTTLRQLASADGRKESGMQSKQLSSVIYIEEGEVYTESEAIVRIFRHIGGIWKPMAMLLGFIPRKWRDFLYRLIANNRYRIFGQKTQCFIAPKEYDNRFVPEIDEEEIKAIQSKG